MVEALRVEEGHCTLFRSTAWTRASTFASGVPSFRTPRRPRVWATFARGFEEIKHAVRAGVATSYIVVETVKNECRDRYHLDLRRIPSNLDFCCYIPHKIQSLKKKKKNVPAIVSRPFYSNLINSRSIFFHFNSFNHGKEGRGWDAAIPWRSNHRDRLNRLEKGKRQTLRCAKNAAASPLATIPLPHKPTVAIIASMNPAVDASQLRSAFPLQPSYDTLTPTHTSSPCWMSPPVPSIC